LRIFADLAVKANPSAFPWQRLTNFTNKRDAFNKPDNVVFLLKANNICLAYTVAVLSRRCFAIVILALQMTNCFIWGESFVSTFDNRPFTLEGQCSYIAVA